VINLAAEKTYSNLHVTLKQANEHRNEWFEGVHKCKATDSLGKVMETIVKAEVHRLVVVSDDDKVVGVVSLSDILSYLVLRISRDVKKDESSASAAESTESGPRPPVSKSNSGSEQLAKVAESSEEDSELAEPSPANEASEEEDQEAIVSPPAAAAAAAAASAVASEITAAE